MMNRFRLSLWRFSSAALPVAALLVPLSARAQQADAELSEVSRTIQQPTLDRETIVPWIVDVYGRNYDNFENQGASKVISDWLTNALIDLDLFNIVNRERIRAVLSERNLALSGLARSVSSDVPENELATAGRLLSVSYILLGNVKNLGTTSEIDFKLLDVETTTYSPLFRLNFEIPFNPSIEKFKLVVDRIVAELAASFPVRANVDGITDDGELLLDRGSASGLVEGLSAELWPRGGASSVATGLLTQVDRYSSELALDQPFSLMSPWAYIAKIAIAPGAESVLSKSRLVMRRGDYEKAREILAAGVETYSGHGRILALHARACRKLRDYEGAVTSYRLALKAEPNDLVLLREAAQVLFEAGFFQEVVELLRDVAGRTESIELDLRLGDALAAQGHWRQAREVYKRAFRLDPEDPRPHLKLAVLAARRSELGEMERELRLAGEGGSTPLAVGLAQAAVTVLRSSESRLEALQPWVSRAVAEDDFESLAVGAQLLLSEPRLWQQALELAIRSVDLNPAFLQGQALIAEAYVNGAELARAVAVLDKALETHPNSVALLVRSGELLSELGDSESAELRLLQAMDLAPDEWRPAEALGDSYLRQSAHLKAVDAYQKALQIAERNSAADSTLVLKKLGRSAVLGNQYATALPYLERCVQASPDDLECRYFLGLSYFISNLPQSDEKAIVNLKASRGFNDDAFYYLGVLYDRREEYQEARDWYQRCVDAGCSEASRSDPRIDEIESIRGTVVSRGRGVKEVSLDVGRIHGVQPSQVALVLHGREVVGRIRTDQVQEKSSVAKIVGGNPLAGHEVVFRPARPEGLQLRKAPKKGVIVTWRHSDESYVSQYIVYRKGERSPNWLEHRRVGSGKNQLNDRSAKPGEIYWYRVSATTAQKQESLPSREHKISLQPRQPKR